MFWHCAYNTYCVSDGSPSSASSSRCSSPRNSASSTRFGSSPTCKAVIVKRVASSLQTQQKIKTAPRIVAFHSGKHDVAGFRAVCRYVTTSPRSVYQSVDKAHAVDRMVSHKSFGPLPSNSQSGTQDAFRQKLHEQLEPERASTSTPVGSHVAVGSSTSSVSCVEAMRDDTCLREPSNPIEHQGDLCDACQDEGCVSCFKPELGDMVVLGAGVPPEFRQRTAVVTQAFDSHCTVIVLDESSRYGVGECWPGFVDITHQDSSLRLGESVIINGLHSKRNSRYNGLVGYIIQHPREGHPSFIKTTSATDQPKLTVNVALQSPPPGSQGSILLEPRFLLPYKGEVDTSGPEFSQAVSELTGVTRRLRIDSAASRLSGVDSVD